MQDRLARTSAQPPFLWHCSAFGNGWKAASDARTMLVYIGNGGARVTSTCLHSLHRKFKTFAVHPRNRSSFRIIATKLSATLPRFRRYLMKRVYRNAISFLFFRSITLSLSLSLSLVTLYTIRSLFRCVGRAEFPRESFENQDDPRGRPGGRVRLTRREIAS